MDKMGDSDKPFACANEGCNMSFTNEDHLTVHKKKHDMNLNLGLGCKTNVFVADQTPTPTRFIRNCEEVGLFQDLQNVNPFEETFRQATELVKSGNLHAPTDLSNNSDDTLHTPHIFPIINEDRLGVSFSSIKSNTIITNTKISETDFDLKTPTVLKEPDKNVYLNTGENESVCVSDHNSIEQTVIKTPAILKSINKNEFLKDLEICEKTDTKGDNNEMTIKDNQSGENKTNDSNYLEIEDSRKSTIHTITVTADHQYTSIIKQNNEIILKTSDNVKDPSERKLLKTDNIKSIKKDLSKTQNDNEISNFKTEFRKLEADIKVSVKTKQQLKQALKKKFKSSSSTDEPVINYQMINSPTNFILPNVMPQPLTLIQNPIVLTGPSKSETQLKTILPIPRIIQPAQVILPAVKSNQYIFLPKAEESKPLKRSHDKISSKKNVENAKKDSKNICSDEDQLKRETLLERNRAAAVRSREKRKKYFDNLEKRNQALMNANQSLVTEVQKLRAELAQVKQLLLAHKDCDVTKAQNAGNVMMSSPNIIRVNVPQTINISNVVPINKTLKRVCDTLPFKRISKKSKKLNIKPLCIPKIIVTNFSSDSSVIVNDSSQSQIENVTSVDKHKCINKTNSDKPLTICNNELKPIKESRSVVCDNKSDKNCENKTVITAVPSPVITLRYS